MTYRKALVTRWSRRDRLAVLTIALVVALVVGTTLLLATAGGQTTRIAAQAEHNLTVRTYDSADTARATSGTTLLTTTVTINGRSHTVVGLPPEPSAEVGRVLPPSPDDGVARGPATAVGSHSIGDTPLSVERGSRGVFPDDWLVTSQATVERLGPDDALVLQPASGQRHTEGVPLVSALAFFVGGSRALLQAVVPLAAGGVVLTGVVVHSVVRMTVRDRRQTIGVLRATGAAPRTILLAFVVRATLLATAGVALGYGIGVIAVNALVTGATSAGVSVTLAPRVTGRVLSTLIPASGVLVLTGVVTGGTAARPVVRRPPSVLLDQSTTRNRPPESDDVTGLRWLSVFSTFSEVLSERLPRLRPRLLDSRALIPALATLSVLVATVVLVVAASATLSPIADPGTGTITESGSPHPVASQVDEEYATVLQEQGVAASPEVLLFESIDGAPVLARGADWRAFANVTGATLTSGRPPRDRAEAVVGADLASRQGFTAGDSVLLGGSTDPAVDRVEIVGVYRARGYLDDQLIASLPTARHLTGLEDREVNLIRVDRAAIDQAGASEESGVVVTALDASGSVAVDDTVAVSAVIRNLGAERVTQNVSVTLGNVTKTRRVTLQPDGRKTVQVQFRPETRGRLTLSAGATKRTINIGDSTGLRLKPLPEQAPPDATLLIRVYENSTPATNVTVSVGPQSARTNESGLARLALPDPGEYTITAGRDSHTLRVAEDAFRSLVVSARVRPDRPSQLTEPTAIVRVTNPWDRQIDRSVTIKGPRQTRERQVSLAPGATRTLRLRLARVPAGSYAVSVTTEESPLARQSYVVSGDARVASAIATSGRTVPGSGLGAGVSNAFGNLRVLLGGLLLLTALATVGAIAAGFASAVHARRETIGIRRATGARPLAVLRSVVVDAARIATVAAIPAVCLGYLGAWLLGSAGLITLFGVSIVPRPSSLVLLGAGVGGIVVACCGAALATIPMLRVPPAALLSDVDREPETPEQPAKEGVE